MECLYSNTKIICRTRECFPMAKRCVCPRILGFMLGNYQMTLFTHVSGVYELICGQRSWGRMNQDEGRVNSGNNSATLTVSRKGKPQRYALTGLDSMAADSTVTQRSFGCGYAAFTVVSCRVGMIFQNPESSELARAFGFFCPDNDLITAFLRSSRDARQTFRLRSAVLSFWGGLLDFCSLQSCRYMVKFK